MLLQNLDSWLVPQNILQEIMIVGVRFDICSDTSKLMKMMERCLLSEAYDAREYKNVKSLYSEAQKYLKINSPYEVKIILALEPTTQNVIGSIVIFTSNSQLSKFYPFIDVFGEENDSPGNRSIIGAIAGPVIDPLYSNLTEIFKYGLICSAITF